MSAPYFAHPSTPCAQLPSANTQDSPQEAGRPHLTHLLYLHGFRSSPQSAKAQQTLAYFAEHYPAVEVVCPQLPVSPSEAAALIESIGAPWPQTTRAVMGSSLGGYYANWAAQQWGCAAVFLNPAPYPARDLARHIGANESWHQPGEVQYFQPHFIEELQRLQVPPNAPASVGQLALIAKGDEVLQWPEMAAHYRRAQQIVLEGSNHALTDVYGEYLPQLAAFLYALGADAGLAAH